MKRSLKIFGIFLIMLILVSGCGKKEEEKVELKEETAPIVEEKKLQILDENSKSRPYAVMINCHNNALPQAGLNKAFLVYELMVEGGITRMLALFKDVNVDKIGSCRSARMQFLGYARENDAIYAHAGGAPDAIANIKNTGLNDVDVDGKYGMRDKTLKRQFEHTLFTSTKLLSDAAQNKKYATTTDKGNLLNYSVDEIDLSKMEDAKIASNISIKYSNYRTSKYTYDAESKTYLRKMNNTDNVDLVTNEQYKVKNIIIYSLKYSDYSYNGYHGYQKIDNIGSGEGLYVTNGYSIPIIWEKASENSKTIYKIKSTKEELKVNDGNTYIQIYPTSGTLTIS